ncbi:rhamnosyltransferase WsaF family glycosyltransferase [Nocardioides dilutus]
MVEALESMGHRNIVYLLDQHGWALEQHQATVARCWPGVQAEIRDVVDGIEDAHAVLATCWESVYPVIASPAAGARMYFVQDYEPLFYPAGSKYLLAEATYQFGLHGVTAGRWLAHKLAVEHGMTAEHFEFGCDVDTYRLDTSPEAVRRRTGVCYYCRPATPRRAHELAMAALELFAEQRPAVEIHIYGERVGNLSFPATQHGLLTPAELNQLYNRCVAGLTLSATNVSLVPHEMLASGCIPVVNAAEHNRLVLDNDHVRYARATPFDLAAALDDLISGPPVEREATAAEAAASVAGASWATAAEKVEQVIAETVGRLQTLARS